MGSTLELCCVRCVACVIFTQDLALRCVRYVRCVKFYARPLRCVRCTVKETAPYAAVGQQCATALWRCGVRGK